jgi:hypothetical protein
MITPTGSEGAGDISFDTWEFADPLRAWVIVQWPEPRGLEVWGPEIALTPEWAEGTYPLLGRADFFGTFAVTFDQRNGPHFHLDYPETQEETQEEGDPN